MQLRRTLLLGLGLGLLLAQGLHARATVGAPLPKFRVLDADDRPLTRASLRGRALVLFYESREAADTSAGIKAALLKQYHALPAEMRKQVLRVGVVDCSGAMFQTFWKRGIREHSRLRKLTIYCDWDGSMRRSFGFKPNDTNLVIADRKGIIRFFRSGPTPARDAAEIVRHTGLVEAKDRAP